MDGGEGLTFPFSEVRFLLMNRQSPMFFLLKASEVRSSRTWECSQSKKTQQRLQTPESCCRPCRRSSREPHRIKKPPVFHSFTCTFFRKEIVSRRNPKIKKKHDSRFNGCNAKIIYIISKKNSRWPRYDSWVKHDP